MSKISLKKLDIKKINIVVTVLIGIALIIAMYLPARSLFVVSSESAPIDIFVQLEDTKSITSELLRPAYGNTIKSINILLGTNNRVNEGELEVELLQDDTIIETWRIRTEDIVDYHYCAFESRNNLNFESGSNYYLRITNFYNGDNNIAVGTAYGNGPATSDVNNCDGQTICAMSYSYNNSLVARMYIVFSLIAVSILVFLCLTTRFLELPSYKIILGAIGVIIAICIIQFDVLQGVKTSISVKSDSDTSLRQSIEPSQICEFEFTDSLDSFDALGFHVYGDNKSEYLVSLVNNTTNTTYFINSEISILQRRQIDGGNGIVLNSDASLCPNGLFEEGNYTLTIQNTSPDTVLDIGISGEATENSNPVVSVSLVRSTFLGKYIASVCIVLVAFYLVALYFLADKNKLNSTSFFIVSVIPASLICLVLFQTRNVPDAEAHFVSAYNLSNIMLGISGDREWMARACDAAYFNSENWWQPVPNSNLESICYAVHHAFDSALDKSIVEAFPDYSKMKTYSFINWLPQALGLTIGRIVGANSIITIYLARIFILTAYILGCLRSIKNTPVGKFVFCAIALLPVNLMLSSSFSYDCMLLIVSLNFIAIVFKLRKEMTKQAIIEALIWGFLLGSIKGGGALLLLPLVFMLFKKDKKTILTIASILAISGFAVLLFGKILAPDDLFQFGIEGDGNYTAGFALSNPIDYLRLVSRSYIVSFNSYYEQIMGSALGWVEEVIPPVFTTIIAGVIIIGVWSEKDELTLNKKDRVIMAIPVLIALLITPAMLLSYTQIGSYMVLGIQGRYYSSILPLIFILIAGYFGDFSDRKNNALQKVLRVFASMICISIYYMLRLYLLR